MPQAVAARWSWRMRWTTIPTRPVFGPSQQSIGHLTLDNHAKQNTHWHLFCRAMLNTMPYSYFTTHDWQLHNHNFQVLQKMCECRCCFAQATIALQSHAVSRQCHCSVFKHVMHAWGLLNYCWPIQPNTHLWWRCKIPLSSILHQ